LKTSLLAVLVGLAGVLTSFAQGVVNFNNNVLTAPPDRTVYVGQVGTPAAGTNILAQLYWSTDGICFTAVTAAPARFRPAGTAPAGTWLGGNRTLPAGVGGVGVTIKLFVVAWDVLNPTAAYGSSLVFDYTQTLSSPPAAADTYMKNFLGGWVLPPGLGRPPGDQIGICVPEPGISFLSLTGLSLIWVLHRRNQSRKTSL
jgi:hypothetical protein